MCGLAALIAPAAGSAQNPTLAPPTTVDGPSADIVSLSGMSIARDGTGGLVYLKNVAGVQHVFVSRLAGGVFQAPQEIDSSFANPSSQPVIAAGNGGVLLVAFVNSGSLYVVHSRRSSSPYGAPLDIYNGASNPSIQMSSFGKAYLAFAAAGDGGSDVLAAYYYNGAWSLESAPLNAKPGDDAGTGQGRPSVATAGDGIATVAWGEGGHIYSRRAWGTSPSVVYEQADVPSLGGWSEVSSQQPSAGAGGDSSFVGVVFEETLTNGSQQQSRVLMNRLQGSQYDGISQPDGLTTPGSQSAADPRIAVGEYGAGLATSGQSSSDEVFAGLLGNTVTSLGATRVDSDLSVSAPDAVPATAGLSSFIVAWQTDQGILGGTSIHARYYTTGSGFGPEIVLSSPGFGPTDASSGLAAGGDVNSDLAATWVQGTGGSTTIEVAQLYETPGAPSARSGFRYARSTRPSLSWNAPNDLWGPVRYVVSLDGDQIGSTTATSFRVPVSVAQGSHTWHVTAVNPAGLQASARNARIFVDSVPPQVDFTIKGKRKAGATLRIEVRYTDAPSGVPARDASGVASIFIRWGDGSTSSLRPGEHRVTHAYQHRGRYFLAIVVKDRAGNKTAVTPSIKIAT